MVTQWVQKASKLKSCQHRFSIRAAVLGFFAMLSLNALVSFQNAANTVPSVDAPSTGHLQSPDHWTSLDGTPIKSGWSFQDGLIHLSQTSADQTELAGGHIITTDEFEDFDLEFEWKIGKNGNSGIKYMVQRYDDRHLGIEYQIYDDDGLHRVEPKNSTGALYDLYAPVPDKPLKPAGEWNRSRIVVQNSQIQHWLNGRLIATATMHDQEWQDRIAASKFHDVPGFCKSRRGRLMLTDHGSDAWYRIISFRHASTSKNP